MPDGDERRADRSSPATGQGREEGGEEQRRDRPRALDGQAEEEDGGGQQPGAGPGHGPRSGSGWGAVSVLGAVATGDSGSDATAVLVPDSGSGAAAASDPAARVPVGPGETLPLEVRTRAARP